MDIFPSKNIHIGGDECPTTAWENNKQCQEMYKRLNLTSYRQLQTQLHRRNQHLSPVERSQDLRLERNRDRRKALTSN